MKHIYKLTLCAIAGAMAVGAMAATPSVTEVFKNKVLKTMTVEGQSRTLNYNDLNQLESVIGTDYSCTFTYQGGEYNGFAYDAIITEVDSEDPRDIVTTSFYVKLNDMGFIVSAYQEEEEDGDLDTELFTFTYDAQGYLTKMTKKEEAEETNLTWIDGNLTKVEVIDQYEGLEGEYDITYSANINANGLMFYDLMGVDLDELEIAYYAGMLGRPSENLPSQIEDEEGDTGQFSWTLSGNDPTQVSYTEDRDTEIITFTWTTLAGISSVDIDAATAEEWYTIDGLKVSTPNRGLYIRRSSDGTTQKVYVK
ncbi:MAG: DUF4595 domain-containing protein [Bacteroidales bacterium]|nr:DUF4595 domain-containing protein [Bacteroidales bacterium]